MTNKIEKFIQKARKVHGDKYDYSKVEYVNSQTKVCIICPIHGEFWQEPAAHVRGYNCPKCANVKRGDTFRGRLNDFIIKAKEVHGDKYDYSKVEYVNSSTKICIICPEHGEFYMTPQNHLLGQGCPKCVGRGLCDDDIIKLFKKVHGNKYDYSKVKYNKMHEKVCIICPEHGEFWQTPSKHINGQNCPKCAKVFMAEKNNLGGDEFIKRSVEKWGDLYDYSKVNYEKIDKKVEIICKKHGSFLQRPYDHLHGHGCPVCGKLESKGEIELYDLICKIVGKENVIHNDRKTLNGKEIDILLPEYNIGIEFDGLRWHSEVYLKDRYYHINKSIYAHRNGVMLIHIFEDEWTNNKDIVINKIKHLLNKNDKKEKIFARKCEIKEINNETAKDFLNKNHIQGFASSTIYIGCFYKNEIVGVMSFLCENDNHWNLNRFSTDINYICCGIGGKLLKYFIRKYNPVTIKSFADRRWTFNDGENIYNKLGFSFINEIKPDYKYVSRTNPTERIHKFNFRKKTLNKRYNLPLSMTELEMAKELGYDRIWDCGLLKYEYVNN